MEEHTMAMKMPTKAMTVQHVMKNNKKNVMKNMKKKTFNEIDNAIMSMCHDWDGVHREIMRNMFTNMMRNCMEVGDLSCCCSENCMMMMKSQRNRDFLPECCAKQMCKNVLTNYKTQLNERMTVGLNSLYNLMGENNPGFGMMYNDLMGGMTNLMHIMHRKTVMCCSGTNPCMEDCCGGKCGGNNCKCQKMHCIGKCCMMQEMSKERMEHLAMRFWNRHSKKMMKNTKRKIQKVVHHAVFYTDHEHNTDMMFNNAMEKMLKKMMTMKWMGQWMIMKDTNRSLMLPEKTEQKAQMPAQTMPGHMPTTMAQPEMMPGHMMMPEKSMMKEELKMVYQMLPHEKGMPMPMETMMRTVMQMGCYENREHMKWIHKLMKTMCIMFASNFINENHKHLYECMMTIKNTLTPILTNMGMLDQCLGRCVEKIMARCVMMHGPSKLTNEHCQEITKKYMDQIFTCSNHHMIKKMRKMLKMAMRLHGYTDRMMIKIGKKMGARMICNKHWKDMTNNEMMVHYVSEWIKSMMPMLKEACSQYNAQMSECHELDPNNFLKNMMGMKMMNHHLMWQCTTKAFDKKEFSMNINNLSQRMKMMREMGFNMDCFQHSLP